MSISSSSSVVNLRFRVQTWLLAILGRLLYRHVSPSGGSLLARSDRSLAAIGSCPIGNIIARRWAFSGREAKRGFSFAPKHSATHLDRRLARLAIGQVGHVCMCRSSRPQRLQFPNAPSSHVQCCRASSLLHCNCWTSLTHVQSCSHHLPQSLDRAMIVQLAPSSLSGAH